jgi:hypothetical protein
MNLAILVVGEVLAVAGNAGPVGLDHHGIPGITVIRCPV